MRCFEDYLEDAPIDYEIQIQETSADFLYLEIMDREFILYILEDLISYIKYKHKEDHMRLMKFGRTNKKYREIQLTLSDSNTDKIMSLYETNTLTICEICELYDISRKQFYEYMSKKKDKFCEPAVEVTKENYMRLVKTVPVISNVKKFTKHHIIRGK